MFTGSRASMLSLMSLAEVSIFFIFLLKLRFDGLNMPVLLSKCLSVQIILTLFLIDLISPFTSV